MRGSGEHSLSQLSAIQTFRSGSKLIRFLCEVRQVLPLSRHFHEHVFNYGCSCLFIRQTYMLDRIGSGRLRTLAIEELKEALHGHLHG